MNISHHAKIRSQQRGIPQKLIELIMLIGRPIYRPGGAVEFRVYKKDTSEVQHILKTIMHNIDRINGDAVLTIDGNVITVYHKK